MLISNTTEGVFPISYTSQVFFALITERNLGNLSYDCCNVYAITLTGGTFDLYGSNGQALFARPRYVVVLGC